MKKFVLQPADAAPANFISTRNACKLCAPLGASIVFRGIEGCLPLVHGSQGCATYIRRYIISHFKEPIDIASSNFSEESVIFGGGDNLKKALDNITRQYRPEAIGIATTCLSETIGDDIRLYLEQYQAAKAAGSPVIIHASTPSYSGTHMEGFHKAVKAVVEVLAEDGRRREGINVIPGFLSTEDLRYLKDILDSFGADYTILPDYSETLDGESWPEYQKLSKGGTRIASIRRMGGASGTIQLGRSLSKPDTAAGFLEAKFGVRSMTLGIPIGIRETDRLFDALEELSGAPTPWKYSQERGRLVDAYIDAHKYLAHTRALIYGEEDLVVGLAAFLSELGIKPALCGSGGRSGRLGPAVKQFAPEAVVLSGVDFLELEDAAGELACDILIGSSKGYPMARKLGKPLVRAGFPIHDRIGANRILHLGYRGAHDLLDRITNTLIAAIQDNDSTGYMNM